MVKHKTFLLKQYKSDVHKGISLISEPDGDYGSLETRVTLETFLQGCAGKVTVLLGQSGSGKTLLMSSLGQQWARRLVSLHICYHSKP